MSIPFVERQLTGWRMRTLSPDERSGFLRPGDRVRDRNALSVREGDVEIETSTAPGPDAGTGSPQRQG